MNTSTAMIAVAARIFSSLDEALNHTCGCARMSYRNNHDGTRSYRLSGDPACPKCRGRGAHQQCAGCASCGMLPGSKVCEKCVGSGFVPMEVRVTA